MIEQHRVIACDRAAAARGVAAGLSAASALAVCPELVLLPRQPVREQQWLERLAMRLAEFSPRLSLEAPDGLVLEVAASLRLFGGLGALRARIAGALQGNFHLAVATTPLAAVWLARAGAGDVLTHDQLPGRLGALPVTVCRWPAPVLELLQGLSVHRLADCLRLPRDALARRTAPLVLQSLDRALGRQADPRRSWQPVAGFREALQMPVETEALAPLLAGLDHLLSRLQAVLRAGEMTVSSTELVLEHAGRAATTLRLALTQPCRDIVHLRLLYAQRLERTVLPAPVIGLALQAHRLEPLSVAPAGELLRDRPTVRRCSGMPQLVERLRSRFGESCVYGLCAVPEHRPEAAWRPVTSPGVATSTGKVTAATMIGCRPLWLLVEPMVLQAVHGWPQHQGRLVLEQGPERIETGWWDGCDVERDYYIARNATGQRLWIYRERRGQRHWWLHGMFG